MKNIILSLFTLLLVSACSSGSTVADTPFNVTGLFQGEFENTSGSRRSTFTLNIVEDVDSGDISGNLIFADEGDDDSGCTFNGLVTGSTAGFSVALVASVSGINEDPEVDENGDPVEQTVSGTINYQLTQSNSGNRMTGTYVTIGLGSCSNASGAGSVVINRI